MPESNQNPLTFVTSTVGNAAGGVAKTAGGVVGAAGRGVGDTVTGVTGSAGKPVGEYVHSLSNTTFSFYGCGKTFTSQEGFDEQPVHVCYGLFLSCPPSINHVVHEIY